MDSKIVSATSDIKKTVNDYFSKQILKANINNVNGSCPTSLEPMINKCIVPCCQTIFELINIIKWLTFNKTCPVCRTVIDESKLIKIKNNSTTSQSKSERGRTSPVSDITPLESSTSSTQREIIRETAARIIRNSPAQHPASKFAQSMIEASSCNELSASQAPVLQQSLNEIQNGLGLTEDQDTIQYKKIYMYVHVLYLDQEYYMIPFKSIEKAVKYLQNDIELTDEEAQKDINKLNTGENIKHSFEDFVTYSIEIMIPK